MNGNRDSSQSIEGTGRFLAFNPYVNVLKEMSAATLPIVEHCSNRTNGTRVKEFLLHTGVSSQTNTCIDQIGGAFQAAFSIYSSHVPTPLAATSCVIVGTGSIGSTILGTAADLHDVVHRVVVHRASSHDNFVIASHNRHDLGKDIALSSAGEKLALANPDVHQFLLANAELSEHAILRIAAAASEFFPHASLSFELAVDREEDWSKLVILVDTNSDDLDRRLSTEDQFYSRIDADDELGEAMRYIVVSFR